MSWPKRLATSTDKPSKLFRRSVGVDAASTRTADGSVSTMPSRKQSHDPTTLDPPSLVPG